MTLPTSTPPPIIKIHDATVVKGKGVRVLDHISLEIGEGQHTAILGPNGSGKSSLIKLIAYLHYPLVHPDGTPPVQVFGRDRWNVFELRQQLGIVSPELHDTFTDHTHGRLRGLDAVITGFFASHGLFQHQEITDAMREAARDALRWMEADRLATRPTETMSTGEARRILIARALVSDPRALLLDEPTTGLDLVATRRFLETLRGLARQGRTIILVTHHVEDILPDIDHVILLKAGRVFQAGPKRVVLTTATLSALYDTPIRVSEDTGGYYRIMIDD